MKIALITGSAKGLGREIALALADFGYIPVIHYHKSREEAERVVFSIGKKGVKTKAYSADLIDETAVGKMVEDITSDFGSIDLLVNNVGNFLFKPFSETSNAEFRDMIESNLYSTLFMSRAVLPEMRKQKSGLIINIGAVGAERLIIRENSTPYFLGKTGIYVLTKVMAAEEAVDNIRINMISPASLKTDIFDVKDFPSGRAATAKDVIKALKFLISPENSYINGANIEVSGGFVPGIEK